MYGYCDHALYITAKHVCFHSYTTRRPILDCLTTSGLMEDCPFDEGGTLELTEETVDKIDSAVFEAYVAKLYQYLQVVETRLFSEGLHVLGRPPSADQVGDWSAVGHGSTPVEWPALGVCIRGKCGNGILHSDLNAQ